MAEYRLTNDFHTNKRIIDDIAIIQSKRLRNKIAGKQNNYLYWQTITLLCFCRFHYPSHEENPKGPSQRYFSQATRRGAFYNIEALTLYLTSIKIRREKGRWTSFQTDQRSK